MEDDPSLYPLHADFLSRLALTFSHGDYAKNRWIDNPTETAITLFKRSLSYHPDHRAFWGLGLVYQQRDRLEESSAVLREGVRHYPGSIDLHLTLAHSLIRLQRPSEARQFLELLPHHPQAAELIIRCCRIMGDRDGEQAWRNHLDRIRR